MRNLKDNEVLVVAAAGNGKSKSSGSSGSGSKGKSSSGSYRCKGGYHYESGSASRSLGGGITGGSAKGSESRSWDGCTPNGQHHDGNGQVVPDKQSA